MWNTSTFGDNTMSNGTGFFNSNNVPNSPQPKSKGQLRRTQSIVPICIRQLKDDVNDEFTLFGMHTQILKIVAILKESDVQSTKATYEIEDHTGSMKVILWLENDNNSEPSLPLVKEGCYLKVYGSLRVQEGEKFLMVLRMFPVDNPNEVTNHLLEVIHVRLEAEALTKGTGLLRKIKENNPGLQLANSMSFMDQDMNMDTSTGSGFNDMQEKVFHILKTDNSCSGVHRSTILEKFTVNQHRAVNDALDFLVNEGHAYSTVDNDHFRATDSM